MKKFDKTTLLAIIIAILAIAVLIVSNIKKEEGKSTSDIYIVTNYNDFYTVNSCLYRTITYIGSNDTNSLMLVLNDEYKSKNKINKNNILSLFESLSANSTFVSKKMYYENLSSTVTKYYIYGISKDDVLNEFGTYYPENAKEMYFIVYLDKENLLFSIEPYDGKIFMDGELNA